MKIFTEEELLPLSLIQHLLFCQRRAALVEIEGLWEDNLFTVEGTHLHQKVDDDLSLESRGDLRVTRGLMLHSFELGLSGKADVVEFHRLSEAAVVSSLTPEGKAVGIPVAGARGVWRPYPVDYKRGRLRYEEGFEAQLCAQALCLEEMLGVAVPEGAIYYGKPRRRLVVMFDDHLRTNTRDAARRLHELVGSGKTPQARYEKKCDSCSLLSLCMPKVTGSTKSVSKYLSRVLAD
ncbi:MAG: CRISPR-associated protein Cas4 [Deltaproteobacteria bacterium RIFOXYD12_FULL_57_12]|nr:MAG: CRISPR-associated protein Cas4 [Deltaproteobacteria bacterium RIFOXYD12_FULL_57_12]